MSVHSLLISVKPDHAKKIFDGIKTVELRRVRPKLSEGDIVLVYVSSPTKALTGGFEVERVIETNPTELWKEVASSSGITQNEFEDYFEGTEKAFGILIKKTWSFDNPLSLNNIKSKWVKFHPPQSYRYVSKKEAILLGVS